MERSGKEGRAEGDGDHVRVLEEAATWFAAMHGGDPTRADREALEKWLTADPRHAEAYANVERLWEGSLDLPGLKERHAALKKAITRRQFGAGVVVGAIGLGAWRYLADYPFADYRTAKGERRRIILPDNSLVDLATETRLSIAFDQAGRRVRLHTGEAFFTVAADAARPFTVAAGEGRTTARGTAFGVACHGDGVTVAVTEHAVDVELGRDIARIAAGAALSYDKTHIGTAHDLADDDVFSWRDGRLVFAQATLGRVVGALNRWRAGRLVIMSDALAARPITLIVNIDRTEAIVAQLAQAVPIRTVSVTPYLTFLFPAI